MSKLDRYFQTPCQAAAVFDTLADVLRDDAVLRSIPITWDLRRGERGEAMPPTSRNLPWVALVPLEMPVKTASEIDDEGRFRVRVDMAVEGTCWRDLANFATAIKDALRHNRVTEGGLTVDQRFQAAGANNYWVKQGGVGVKRTEATPAGVEVGSAPVITDQISAAVVEFELFLPNID
jgi:hypothetical protein